jgi:hypothetical protein
MTGSIVIKFLDCFASIFCIICLFCITFIGIHNIKIMIDLIDAELTFDQLNTRFQVFFL